MPSGVAFDGRDAGYAGSRVAAAAAIAARAVEHDHAGVLQPPRRLAGRATLKLRRIHIGHHAAIGLKKYFDALESKSLQPQTPWRSAT